MARKLHGRRWRRAEADPVLVGPLLREQGFIGDDADPVSVRASFDGAGRPRRLHARYASGWTCTLHIGLDDRCSLSQSLRIRVAGRLPR